MINRTLVRTKVVQTLFAYYQTEGTTPMSAQKQLLASFSDTYSLYYLLLDLVNELIFFAESMLDASRTRAQISHKPFEANRRFVDNRFAKQLFENRRLRTYKENTHLNWDSGQSAIAEIYRELISTDFYKEYMSAPKTSYEEDKTIWRKIFTFILPESEALATALEEMEIAMDHQGWGIDQQVVCSYVVKTIKSFRENDGADQALLEMFDTEDELSFAKQLLQTAIQNGDEYRGYISAHLKNWDSDRIAYMDKVILITALAEITHFDDIPVQVSMNEYIELDKEYSGDKNFQFINGILNEILRQMIQENKLFKAIR